jgi:ATP-dependent helicase/nuclease subunit A
MPPSFTPEQRAAIDTRDVAVALSAGAGCGKTFVLTERFLSYLEPSADESSRERTHELGEIVAFTYTERAAREMRDRIRRKCQDRLAAASDGDAAHWLRLLRDLDTARVSTIHSFCTSLLRAHAVEAGLDPHFSVLDAAQAPTIAWELLDDVLRAHLENREPATMRLASRLSAQSAATTICFGAGGAAGSFAASVVSACSVVSVGTSAPISLASAFQWFLFGRFVDIANSPRRSWASSGKCNRQQQLPMK